MRQQRLEYRLRFGPFLRQRTFDEAQLHLTSSTDSDGDTRYQLSVRTGRDKRTIVSSLYDDAEVNDCASWMAARPASCWLGSGLLAPGGVSLLNACTVLKSVVMPVSSAARILSASEESFSGWHDGRFHPPAGVRTAVRGRGSSFEAQVDGQNFAA